MNTETFYEQDKFTRFVNFTIQPIQRFLFFSNQPFYPIFSSIKPQSESKSQTKSVSAKSARTNYFCLRKSQKNYIIECCKSHGKQLTKQQINEIAQHLGLKYKKVYKFIFDYQKGLTEQNKSKGSSKQIGEIYQLQNIHIPNLQQVNIDSRVIQILKNKRKQIIKIEFKQEPEPRQQKTTNQIPH